MLPEDFLQFLEQVLFGTPLNGCFCKMWKYAVFPVHFNAGETNKLTKTTLTQLRGLQYIIA